MKNIKNIKVIVLTAIISIGLGLGTNAAVKSSIKSAPVKTPVVVQKPVEKLSCDNYPLVSSLTIAANPTKYLNKRVKIRAKFDKFSTLGLDYKPAFRSSEKYITFLIKRDDVINHTVPLSEMKNFLPREEAEKYIDLKPGDLVEYCGIVFSDALSDTWINVEKFTVLSSKKSENSTKK